MATEPPESGQSPAPVGRPRDVRRHIPNALTIARLALTVVFVALLSVYRFPDQHAWALPVALVVFIVAALTDALDGYLARRWNVISVFGRIMDPFADKLLILGAFVMLVPIEGSGVASWMVVVILGRELLVTTIRGVLEGRGVDFSAARSGKLKMIAQSVAAPVILGSLIWMQSLYNESFIEWRNQIEMLTLSGAFEPNADPEQAQRTFAESGLQDDLFPEDSYDRYRTVGLLVLANELVAWLVTMITAISAIPYVIRAGSALRRPDHADG